MESDIEMWEARQESPIFTKISSDEEEEEEGLLGGGPTKRILRKTLRRTQKKH